MTVSVSRRTFITRGTLAGTGILIAVELPATILIAQESSPEKNQPGANPFEAWVHVKPGGEISLIVAKSEMGQGIRTGLAIPLAEELEVDLSSIKVEQAETRPDIYSHLGTGGSGSTMENFMPLRRAGATVRELMITAAAARWKVARSNCMAKHGAVFDKRTPSRRASYAELVDAASRLPLPDPKTVPLKAQSAFRLIGRAVPRVDVPAKTNGTAQFGLDVRLPEMLFAVVARCPTFGGKPSHFKTEKAQAISGVRDIFEIAPLGAGIFTAGGVVVVADSTWAAMQGRRALEITWDRGPAGAEASDALGDSLREATARSGKRIRNDGDVDLGLAHAATHIEALYELPFQAHATMEPMNITIHRRNKECEVWAPTQSPDWVQRTVAQILSLPQEKVIVHTTFMGGGFGRRYMADYPAEAAQIAKTVDKPVQLVWTREDDMAHDFYRPASCHRLRGALDARRRPVAWYHAMASTSIRAFWDPKAPPEEQEVGGAQQMPYAIPHVRLEYNPVSSSVPRAWWRSVENSFNGFVVESFIDELAAAAKRDPVEFRRSLLVKPKSTTPAGDDDVDPERLARILEIAAQKAGWGKPLPRGRGRGIAAFASFGSYFAEVAEVSLTENRNFKIDRVVAAVDCGTVVNSESVRSQTEGAIIYGLSAALKNEITIKNGAVEQTNFSDYDPIRIHEAPPIEVVLAPNGDDCGGMGEPGLPPIAPAVANAIFAASGQRFRRLPLRLNSES
ncbi:MAG: xanthine dehydrogenase family protein molybdopterin-binding subunit [Acidobacteria bacterium]|nr:xanthine dehydrogenase family protein molybdopterin-binding subunit [Acidobacteriota bacterium]